MLTESSPRLHRFPDLFRRAGVLRNVAIIGGLPAGRGQRRVRARFTSISC